MRCCSVLSSQCVWAVVAWHLVFCTMCFCASLKGRGNPYAVLTSVQTTQRPHLYLTTGHMFLRFVKARHGQMRKRRRNPAHARGANTQSAQEDESEIPPLRAAAALGCRLVAEGGLRLPPPPLRSRARADPRRTATRDRGKHPAASGMPSSPDLQRKHHAPLDEASGVGRTNMVVVLFSMMKGIEKPPKTASGETGAMKDGKTQVVFAIGIDGTRIE